MNRKNDLALFVYGSLQPGESYWTRYCEGRVVEQQRARVRGRLYRLSDGYLALREPAGLPQDPWIRGWRLVLRDETALHNIDRLEEFDPAGPPEKNVYLRVRTACFADDGAEKPMQLGEAWIYVMAPVQLEQFGARDVSLNAKS